MKVTLTYKTSNQIGPQDWDIFTKVIHVNPGDTILDIYQKHFQSSWTGDVDVELHINVSPTR